MFDFQEDKFTLLLHMLKNDGVINDNQIHWIKCINIFNKKIIFPKLEANDKNFFEVMKNMDYNEFERQCRAIATQEEVNNQQKDNEADL